jgi:hypothetical protein
MRTKRPKYIRGIVKHPGKAAAVTETIENSLDGLQRIVEGYIETVTMDDCVVICNEEGRLLGMKHNCVFRGVDFVGPVIVVGRKYDEFVSLGESDVLSIAEELNGGGADGDM